MHTRRTLAAIGLVAVLSAASFPWPGHAFAASQAADTLPAKLEPLEMWRLSQDLSEADGFFQSENLVSNEIYLQWVIPELLARGRTGGVYLGVGPEQNFTYIASLKPKMVFITDVRRGNLHMHLMYKAIFELTNNRADFLELLFTKKRPAGLSGTSTVAVLTNAFWDVQTSEEAVYKANVTRILDHLTKTRGLPLEKSDLDGIEYVYWNFYWHGMQINYSSSSRSVNSGGRGNMVMYGDLMLHTDGNSVSRHYLVSEDSFRVLKNLHEKNLFVPVVGNFAGPKALRAVGKYVRDHGSVISAMYLSNVEQYLYQDGIWNYFCGNIASMPLDDKSLFIRSFRGGAGAGGSGLVNGLGSMLSETRGCGRPAPAVVR